jgi:hypothetical protein
LLGSNLETDNDTKFAARQQIFNKEEYTAAARERFGKQVPAEKDTHATVEELLVTREDSADSAKTYTTKVSDIKTLK